ncbi:bifunctional GTP diphosphokinase/guanosine-3',5'-bis pyrophosphate 3'-pyrophosphohydrolase [Litoribrevibacter albus]|uniref:guanosine-3',5'-bis(diphosphate) 3'-diphosphatase n=1 Tax=Litoribrevibacter albus TaxID=1473156 RepID=A0AA37SCP9_9GAMM|nr:bifunctional GTP diphosphokinase/guanosine-3',5'-bis pyrophosphate 3'-pyrophosphohydrolase [Litoribrevibacter albus]GLQ33009.1 guanosine-3',5'-bis(diphosphate) 3'-pyrophosphohydrolase [Litoribrevibacter albus]
MLTIDDFATQLTSYLPSDKINLVRRAYYYAEQAHEGQKRRSGEPYVTHPLEVAQILSEIRMDHQSLMAAMLHDVIEDTEVPKTALLEQFGEEVTEIVDGVSKLTQIHFESKEQAQAENFQKMALAMSRDIRVILVKLADRMHNMRTLGALRPDKRRRIARETLDIYSPIAHRLGINDFRIELEDLCFQAMYPMRARMIQKAVNKISGHRKEIVADIKHDIEDRLEREGLIGRVEGRQKHLYSIYQKMDRHEKSFHEIMDVFAFRIVTDTVDSCYRVLGVIHNLFKPVPDRFKDYIAIPKANGYQSLHTTLFGVYRIPIEVQIRTEEMDAVANMGIASHWLYKNDNEVDEENGQFHNHHARARQWVKGLLEIQKNAGNPLEFIENVKLDLFPDEVYVFTPKGDILEMPTGVTAVDFAYNVHTDIGNSCVACRIDRHLAPLSQPLQSGQTVEIITSPGAQPNPAWLDFVVTAKARSAIRHFLKNQKRSESMELGRRLLNKSLYHFELNLDELSTKVIDSWLDQAGIKTLDDLLEEIGLGNRMAYLVARQLMELTETEMNQPQDGVENIPAPLMITGTEGMVIKYAKCCRPIPGDPIVGHMSSGRGLVIHNEACKNLNEFRGNTEKLVSLTWKKQLEQEFSVELKVGVENVRGVVASIATSVTEADANIESITLEDHDARIRVVDLVINVQGREHLARVMKRLKVNKAVVSISRERA